MGSYIPSGKEEQLKMLKTIGLEKANQLFEGIPDSIRAKKMDLPAGLSEMEVYEKLEKIAEKNKVFPSIFRGAGVYNHYIPAIVKRVTSKEEFLTAYTPYQPEISQGILQSIFEYQTMICELTDMEVSNASVYDGATAAAEGVLMCKDKNRKKVLISETVNPMTAETIKTYCPEDDFQVVLIPSKNGRTDMEALKEALDNTVACFYVQQPNFYGIMEEGEELGTLVHDFGGKYIMGVNPIAISIMKTPGECHADIAVGEGQPLGIEMGFGGPYLGFMAATKEMLRKLPGRIVGETEDKEGKRAFVLTLQAREQHIRREKAFSNICSNQALCAMKASVYMAAMGRMGMEQTAQLCYGKAHYAAKEIEKIEGFSLRYDNEFFHEFLTECSITPEYLIESLEKRGILGGLLVDGGILWCVTEKNSKKEIDHLIQMIKEVIHETDV